jgi:hypothetical protein
MDISNPQFSSLRGRGMTLKLDQQPDRATLIIESGGQRIEVRGHPAVGSRFEGSPLDRIIDSIPKEVNLSALFANEQRHLSADLADPILDALEKEEEIRRRFFTTMNQL